MIRLALCLLLLIGPAAAAELPATDLPGTGPAGAQAGSGLKVATWNLEWLTARPKGDPGLPDDAGPKAAEDIAALRRYADTLDADVVAFQKVHRKEPLAASTVSLILPGSTVPQTHAKVPHTGPLGRATRPVRNSGDNPLRSPEAPSLFPLRSGIMNLRIGDGRRDAP